MFRYLSGLVLFILLLSVSNLFAAESLKFEYIPIDYGYARRTVNCIFQDSMGYLWFGTRDGLKRYDGYEFTYYRPQRNDSTSISSFFVTSIAETKDGALWIGTKEGLNRFDRAKEQFIRYLPGQDEKQAPAGKFISALSTDSRGNLWIGVKDKGLDKYDPQSKIFYHYPFEKEAGIEKIFSIYADKKERIWLGLRSRFLNSFNTINKKFTSYSSQFNYKKPSNSI